MGVSSRWILALGIWLVQVTFARALPEAKLPLLFMDKNDLVSPWGRTVPRANSVSELKTFNPPPCNWVNGDTVFAAFPILDEPGAFEVFVAVGRPGEPLAASYSKSDIIAIDGVNITRYTTKDFINWSPPVVVLYLPNGSGDKQTIEKREVGAAVGDGQLWTAKSMDRNDATGEYLMAASYGAAGHTFRAVRPVAPDAFVPTTGTLKTPNFKDHDDINLYFDEGRGQWVDMQITYQLWNKTYCDNCKGARRVVTTRASTDGLKWSDDASCLDHPQKDEHCKNFNTSNMITANPEDPPELEFYRVRVFKLGASGRVAAHALLYVPSPKEVVVQPGYGRQPLWYCKDGCCHGPHMYDEWWVGPPDADPTKMMEWRRPFFDTHAFPHDIWAMAQPLVYNDNHVWVDNGKVWGLPLYRMSGIYTSSNAEFATQSFQMPKSQLWVNAQVLWQGGNHVGDPEGCDEGCAAYLMAELQDATGKTIPGHERGNCIIMNKDGLRLPLAWNTTAALPAPGTLVQLRLFFREATVYAVGSDDDRQGEYTQWQV